MSINESEAIKMYNNPKQGLWGKTKMLKKYKAMLNKVYALQRHKEVKAKHLKKQYKREGAIRPFFSVQVDLADFPKLQNPLNNNTRYLLICIDVFSRFLWVMPLTTKSKLHIPLRQLFQHMKSKYNKTPQNLTADNEFDTTEIKKLASDYKFRLWYGDPYEKYRTGIVERVIRTIRNLIKRYLTQNDTTKYIDVLPDIVSNYNDTEHGHTHTRPRIALKSGQTFPKPMKHTVPILKAGDFVRVLNKRQRGFDKGDKPYYGKELYEVIKKVGNKYTIRNVQTGNIPRKTYYVHQLLLVKGVIHDKYAHAKSDKIGYDKGIEHKQKQRKNKRKMRGLDMNNIIDKKERQQIARDLHYDDKDLFHDKPLPKNISDKQLDNKRKQLEQKVDKVIAKDKIKQNKNKKNNINKSKNNNINKSRLKNIKKKKKQIDKIQPLRRSTRVRKRPVRWGYDENVYKKKK